MTDTGNVNVTKNKWVAIQNYIKGRCDWKASKSRDDGKHEFSSFFGKLNDYEMSSTKQRVNDYK